MEGGNGVMSFVKECVFINKANFVCPQFDSNCTDYTVREVLE